MQQFTPPQNRCLQADKHGVASAAKDYLTFRVARQDLAADASRVRAILPLAELSPLPGVRSGLLGFAGFTGGMVAVLDLAGLLGLKTAASGRQPKIVIVELSSGALAGFVADTVSAVVAYHDRNLDNGLLKGDGRPRRLIDIDTVFPG
jgi:chemotaxis signal transduction protein